MQVLENAMVSVGRRYMVGSIWMSLLRFPRCRSAGIKFLSSKIQRMQSDDDKFVDSDDYSDDSVGEK
jgi:hypothetical protein